MLHDEAGGVVEVRDVMTGALVEIVQYPGIRPILQPRAEGDMLCLSSTGLTQIVEVSFTLAQGGLEDLLYLGPDFVLVGELADGGRL